MNDMSPFDYSGVAVGSAQSVRDAATRIKCRMARTALDIIEIGRDLIEVKRSIGHGNFLPWIEAEFGMSQPAAYRFMQAAENIGDKLKLITEISLAPSVIYALAAPSTPDEARAEIVGRVERGEKVTAVDVKELKAKLADRDEKYKKLKSQKEAVEGHVSQLMNDVRGKTNRVTQLSDEVAHLEEEVRRLMEPGTITVPKNPDPPHDEDGVIVQSSDADDAPHVDIAPWQTMIASVWSSAPPEARAWIIDYVAERA